MSTLRREELEIPVSPLTFDRSSLCCALNMKEARQ
jgi:hypothetical protein